MIGEFAYAVWPFLMRGWVLLISGGPLKKMVA
jgi:hypothetical protein